MSWADRKNPLTQLSFGRNSTLAAALSDDNFAMVAKLALTAPVPWWPFLFYFLRCNVGREISQNPAKIPSKTWWNQVHVHGFHNCTWWVCCTSSSTVHRKVQLIAMMPSTYLDISYGRVSRIAMASCERKQLSLWSNICYQSQATVDALRESGRFWGCKSWSLLPNH